MYPDNGHVGVDNATQTQCLEFSPNGQMKKWLMIDENTVDTLQRELIDQSKNEKWGAWCSVAIEINKDK